MTPTGKDIAKVLDWFKENVGLAGWLIEISLADDCPSNVGGNPNDYAASTSTLRFHRLRIWLNCRLASSHEEADEYWKTSLIHELIHGAFTEISIRNSLTHEYLIDGLAKALVKGLR